MERENHRAPIIMPQRTGQHPDRRKVQKKTLILKVISLISETSRDELAYGAGAASS